ncbi:hypothetical protein [Robertmurraya andreesenii]|uniref:Carotenoid cleavage dioxygenase-like enzyme n=1 Tax=Anoxybacillus andreesenii TaxID=1325932 RepID=A0ABT9V3G0_9BACL|nr:hypothetical protein [Robertmurraya andreesenii]MDQ0155474.1 carotenoid cleavage dioxygenase-like enzyme [Robertmurraya andreesenii]
MMKKMGLLFLSVLMSLYLVGCTGGSYVITIGEINSTKNSLSGEYNQFSGHYYAKVKLDNQETLVLNFSAETKKGELIARVIDSDGKTIKTLKPGDTVELNQSGQYKLQIEGEKHQGSFTMSWEIE